MLLCILEVVEVVPKGVRFVLEAVEVVLETGAITCFSSKVKGLD